MAAIKYRGGIGCVLGALAIWASVASPSRGDIVFGEHPRLDTPAGDERSVKSASRYIEEGLDVPREYGQWIYYYACPEHNKRLMKGDDGHTCSVCGKVYNDERTHLAWVTSLHYRLDDACLTMARAWRYSGREEFARETWGIMTRYAELAPGWRRHDRWGRMGIMAVTGGKRYAQSLDDAVGIIKLARAYDLIYDWRGIEDSEREKVEARLFRATVDSVFSMYLLYESKDNHMTWRNAAAAVVGAVLGEESYVDTALNGAKGLRWQLSNSVTSEGLWYEGALVYHFYALSAIGDTLEAARALGLDVSVEEELKERMYAAPPSLAYPNGRLPAINDSDPANLSNYRAHYIKEARHSANPIIKAVAAGGDLPRRGSETLEDAGLAYLWQWGGQPMVAILDFGQHGDSHGHPDKLNLLLYARGGELFPDIGRISYRVPEHLTWAKQTVAHNTVVLGRRSQDPDDGRTIAFATLAEGGYVVGESEGAYKGALLRRALILLPGETLVDLFLVRQSETPEITDWVLHATVPCRIEGGRNSDAAMTRLAEGAGYEHVDIKGEIRTAENLKLIWETGGDGRFATWLLNSTSEAAETVYSGTGIGYSLNERFPLVIRTRAGSNSKLFAAVHAPDAGAPDSWRFSERDGGYRVEGRGCAVIWDGEREVSILRDK